MRKKKTAPHNRRHQKTSTPRKLGLIVKENQSQQSARTESVLDNHFHRTAVPPVRPSARKVTSLTVISSVRAYNTSPNWVDWGANAADRPQILTFEWFLTCPNCPSSSF